MYVCNRYEVARIVVFLDSINRITDTTEITVTSITVYLNKTTRNMHMQTIVHLYNCSALLNAVFVPSLGYR